MTIADRIRERMAALNLNQLSTARRAGLGADYVRDILRGRVKEPGGRKLAQLATTLECSVEYLLGATDITGKPPALVDPFEDVTDDLPITHRLAAGVFRHSDAEGNELPGRGTISTAYPGIYGEDGVWLALVEDEHAQPLIPRGYVLQILEHKADAFWLLNGKTPSDLVILEHFASDGALVERTVVKVSHHYRNHIYLRPISGDGKIPPLTFDQAQSEYKIIGWVLEARRRFDGAGCYVEGVWPRLS